MNAHVEQSARGSLPPAMGKEPRPSVPAVLVVNGARWTSEIPQTSGDAWGINEDAAIIVAAINRKP